MKKYILLFSTVALIVYACSKDQKVVRQLDGEWKVTDVKNDGVSADAASYQNTSYTFEKCRVHKDDCSGSLKIGDPSKGEFSFPFTYSIDEKGTKITIHTTLNGVTSTSVGQINEHSKSKFVWTSIDSTSTIQTTIEKK